MSLASLSLPDLLRLRLNQVAQLSEATQRLQKQQQTRAAAELEAMRCELAMQNGDREELARELHDAQRRVEDAETERERCEALIEVIESRLVETDREIGERTRR